MHQNKSKPVAPNQPLYQRWRFHGFQLWFLIPGIGLILVSIYVPISYLHKQLFWTETDALIIEWAVRHENIEAEVYCVMDFTDAGGTLHRIEAYGENTFMEGRDSNYVRIYYDPTNPPNFELVNPGWYMLILFFPFGLLCSYLGWPRRE